MARRSSRIHEVGEKSGLRCMGGLFSILESCQGRPGHMVISNGRPASRNIIDYPRALDTIASFDEECRKIHNGAGQRSDSVRVDCRGRSTRSCIGDKMPVEQHRNKRDMARRQQYARSMNELPSTSTERDSTVGAVCAENHPKEIQLSEYLQRNSLLEKYDKVDNICIQQVQMRAKAFVDQMYIDRRIVLGEGRNSESKSFSNALEVLSSKRDLYMEFLPDPNSMIARRSKNMTEKDKIESELSEDSISAKSRSTLVMDEAAIMNNNILQRINYELMCSSKANFTAQPSDKIVILRPAPRNGKHLGNRTCSCSSLQHPYKSNIRVSEEKTASFSFREIKKKLKLSFGVTKKETRNCCSSSTIAEKERKVLKNKVLKSSRGSDIACVADTTRRKLYVSSDRSSNKLESGVILEAKRHLSTRLNNLNSVEGVTSRKSPITLERILSSPVHDSWPFSPRRDSLYCPGSAEMRFSPYNTSPRVIESSCHVQNELRPNKVDATAYSVTQRTEAASIDNNIPTSDKMQADGESTKPSETTDTVKAQKYDGIVLRLASLAENEAVTSTLDDFPSTSSYGHHIDSAENIKFQEEHQSPVSVLEPFFVKDANSPPSISLQTGRKPLQPHRLVFEECSFESSPQHTPASAHPCMEEQLCQYVQLVMDASSLDWEHLSEIRPQPELQLIHESLFDEVELPPLGCYYDPKLLFDRINQLLLEMYECHHCSPLPVPLKARSGPLAEAVLDEILAEAVYFILPTSERRSLDEIVSEGAKCGPWLDDVRLDTERIVAEISEAILEEALLEFHASEV